MSSFKDRSRSSPRPGTSWRSHCEATARPRRPTGSRDCGSRPARRGSSTSSRCASRRRYPSCSDWDSSSGPPRKRCSPASTDRGKLRETASRERQAIDSLVRTAETIGREHGVGAQILDRVGETLQAASSDPQVAEAIEKGRLTREQRAAGIGLVGPATPKAPARGQKKGEREAADRAARQQQAKRRKEAERKLAAAEKRLERERAKLERAREAVEEAEEAVHNAELDAHAARRALDEL